MTAVTVLSCLTHPPLAGPGCHRSHNFPCPPPGTRLAFSSCRTSSSTGPDRRDRKESSRSCPQLNPPRRHTIDPVPVPHCHSEDKALKQPSEVGQLSHLGQQPVRFPLSPGNLRAGSWWQDWQLVRLLEAVWGFRHRTSNIGLLSPHASSGSFASYVCFVLHNSPGLV
jgi:hypothetical protein